MNLSKTPSKQTPLIAALTVLAFSLVFSLYSSLKNPTKSYAAPIIVNAAVLPKQEETNLSASPLHARSGLPVRLKIPAINVDAAIEYAGVASNGVLDSPKIPDDVAWFRLGPRPGENGSAVIDGHYGWSHGKAAAFDNLYKLRKGDKLSTVDDKGVVSTFVVRETRRYNPTSDVSDVFGSNDGKSHLNLITCEGVWDKVSKSYSSRLVVFTDKE